MNIYAIFGDSGWLLRASNLMTDERAENIYKNWFGVKANMIRWYKSNTDYENTIFASNMV
jgi:hypothetical protein